MEFFRGKDIEAIDKNAFYEYQEWRTNYHVNKKKSRKDKRTLTVGNASINRDLGLLVSILKYAKEELNILNKVKVPKWKALPEKTRNEILSSQEIDSLRAYWLKKNAFYWDIMNFILNTGLRYPSEINKLKWKNIMLDKRLMFIKRKSRLADKDKYFPVQIYDEAYEILIKLKNRNVPTGLEDFVFVDEEGKQIANIKKGFRASLKACGIDKHFPMFCFRHQFATEMTARGVPPKALSEQMWHKSLRMVDGTYTHLMREHHAIIAERIGMDKNGHKQAEIVKRFKDDWVLTEDFGKGMTEEEFLEFERKIISSEEFQDMLKNHFNNK
jgi:integrase